MTIREAIDALSAAAKQLGGDADLVHVRDDQFCDVVSIKVWREPSETTARVWFGPITVITLGE